MSEFRLHFFPATHSRAPMTAPAKILLVPMPEKIKKKFYTHNKTVVIKIISPAQKCPYHDLYM